MCFWCFSGLRRNSSFSSSVYGLFVPGAPDRSSTKGAEIQVGERTIFVKCAATLAISGTIWIADELFPMTATRLPSKLVFFAQSL